MKNITLPVGSIAAWMATIGNAVFAVSHWPTSSGSPASAAAAATAAARLGAGSDGSSARLGAARIRVCSRACSGPSVVVSIARRSRSLMPGTPTSPL